MQIPERRPFYDKIREMCDKKGVSISKMVEDVGLGNSTAAHLKNGRVLTVKNINAIAMYFDESPKDLLMAAAAQSSDNDQVAGLIADMDEATKELEKQKKARKNDPDEQEPDIDTTPPIPKSVFVEFDGAEIKRLLNAVYSQQDVIKTHSETINSLVEHLSLFDDVKKSTKRTSAGVRGKIGGREAV